MFGEFVHRFAHAFASIVVDDHLAGSRFIGNQEIALEGYVAVGPPLVAAIVSTVGSGDMREDHLEPASEFSGGISPELSDFGVGDKQGLLNQVGRGEVSAEISSQFFLGGHQEIVEAVLGQLIEGLAAASVGAGDERRPTSLGRFSGFFQKFRTAHD